jgi:hypothetical protein
MNPTKLRPRPATIKAIKIPIVWKIKKPTLAASRTTFPAHTTLCVVSSLILFVYRPFAV